MQTLFLLVVLFSSVTVWGQIEKISDPGFLSLAENQCSPSSAWWFRSDFLWNQTNDFVDAQCQAFLELPTDARSGLTKGNETNINHFLIPQLPNVMGGDPEWPSSAAVIDLNSPCRSALWAPFELTNDNATVNVEFFIWASALPDGTEQFFIDNSLVPNATLLQYLPDPFGLLQQDNSAFPPVQDIVNQIRVDIIKPDGEERFYDHAFSLDPVDIALSFAIPGFGDDDAIPQTGTDKQWMFVNVSAVLENHGKYALRFASAHSVIGGAWGVSDVHLVESGGTVPENHTITPFEWDMVIDNTEQTVGGTLTVSKLELVLKKNTPHPASKKASHKH